MHRRTTALRLRVFISPPAAFSIPSPHLWGGREGLPVLLRVARNDATYGT